MNDHSTKFAILGDIHANLEALQAVLQDARDQGCTRYACVGDLVGYNASPRECLDLIRGMAIPCVKGNHDECASNEVALDSWNPRAAEVMHWTRRELGEVDKQWLRELGYVRAVAGFSMVHASLDMPERWGYILDGLGAAASFAYQTTPVCFFGHTHVPLAFVREGWLGGGRYSRFRVETGRHYLVNVGSVGEPRDGLPLAGYVTYSPATGWIELRRVAYDFERTEARLMECGLPARRKQ